MKLKLLFLSLFNLVTGSTQFDQDGFKLSQVETTIDVTQGRLLIQDTTIAAEALKATNSFVLAFPSAENILALLEVRLGDKTLSTRRLSSKDGIAFYSADLGKTVSPKQSVTLNVKSVLTKQLRPFPRQIAQGDKQLYEFLANAYFLSLYHSDSQKTIVILPNREEPNAYSKEPSPVSFSPKQITYGPYKNVPALAQAELYVHYPDNAAVLVNKEYTSTVEVSHWGANLNVNEDFEVHHQGAALKGQFSRIDFKLNEWSHGKTSVVKSLVAVLPAGATDVYFKDAIGNVSTSAFRNERKRSILELQPRFPLYGGWRYTWFHGFNVPSKQFLKVDAKTGKYVLQYLFKPSVSDLVTESASLKVVLPEGAANVKWGASEALDSVTHSTTYTYLDSIGRPTLLFKKKNLVDLHNVIVQIEYDYEPVKLLQKPIVVSIYSFGFFVVLMVYARVDLSITKDPLKEIRENLQQYKVIVHKEVKRHGRALSSLHDAFEKFKASRDAAGFKTIQEEADSELASVLSQLELAVTKTASIDGVYSRNLVSLIVLLKERVKLIKELHSEVTTFLKDAKLSADSEKKKKLTAFIDATEARLGDVRDKIQVALKAVSD